ncbi:MAG TPA: hypothetical protein VD997_12295 [Phycisphaerales bacterium]|nr:hypothetical protein [Phycisphaerales bacterium]
MDRSRRIAWAVTITGLVGLGVSSMVMVRRVQQFHKDNPRVLFAFQRIDDREFRAAGKPVTITDDTTDPAKPKLVIDYAGEKLTLDVAIPPRYELPGLKKHEDWLRVLRFAPFSGMTEEQFQQTLKEGKDRLAIVTRTPPAGVDPATWGTVWRKAWVFDFYEFKPEGGFTHETLKYPSASGLKKPREGELQENTWQHQAALQLMPNAGQTGPTRNFYGDALRAAGISLPAAAFSGLAAALGLAFAFAPRKRKA